MPTDKKKKAPAKKAAKKNKTTAKDMPGSGMAKKAATAIEKRKKRMREALNF